MKTQLDDVHEKEIQLPPDSLDCSSRYWFNYPILRCLESLHGTVME